MLSLVSLEATNNLATLLANRGIALSAMPNTPLGELVKLSYVANDISINQDLSTDNHNASMDAFIEQIYNAIATHTSFTTNTVIPVLKRYDEAVRTLMASSTTGSASDSYAIVQKDIPAPFKDISFQDTLEGYKGRRPIVPKLGMFGKKTLEELLNIINTGDGILDETVKAWLSSREPDFLVRVWDTFFSDNTLNYYSRESLLEDEPFTGLDWAIAIFLLGRGILSNIETRYTNVAEGTVDAITLTDYNVLVGSIMDFAGTMAWLHYGFIENIIANNILILGFNDKNSEIYVYGPTYKTWLEGGINKPDTLIGAVLSGKNRATAENITVNKESYDFAWSSYKSLYASNAAARQFDTFKNHLIEAFNANLADTLETLSGNNISGFKDIAIKNFTALVREVTPEDIAEVSAVCRRLITRSFFYYTDAEKHLEGMVVAKKFDDTLTAHEAFTVSVIDCVVEYIAAQITVK